VPAVFTTLTAVIATVVFLLPGFVVADLAQRQRAGSATLGDQRAVLRSLFFSVLIHLVVSYWTWWLVQELDGDDWADHYGATVLYVAVVSTTCSYASSGQPTRTASRWSLTNPPVRCGSPSPTSQSCTSSNRAPIRPARRRPDRRVAEASEGRLTV
jgi:hypothetical protein